MPAGCRCRLGLGVCNRNGVGNRREERQVVAGVAKDHDLVRVNAEKLAQHARSGTLVVAMRHHVGEACVRVVEVQLGNLARRPGDKIPRACLVRVHEHVGLDHHIRYGVDRHALLGVGGKGESKVFSASGNQERRASVEAEHPGMRYGRKHCRQTHERIVRLALLVH